MRETGAELKNRCHACGQPKRGHVCNARMRGGPQVDLGQGMDGAEHFGALPPPPPPLSVPELRRTRSGNRLLPIDDAAAAGYSGGFSVDVDAVAPPGGLGGLERSNTSFFKNLAGSDLFSPSSRDMFLSWSDSPRDAVSRLGLERTAHGPSSAATVPHGSHLRAAPRSLQPPGIGKHVADDLAAPPSLRRVASGDVTEAPKLT